MTKKDLRVGMVVELRNGDMCIVLENSVADEGKSVFKKWNCVAHLDSYRDDLTHKHYAKYDIVKVSDLVYSAINNLNAFCEGYAPSWGWKRQEPKEITVAEIEKLLGYPVKIIAEKEEVKYKVGDKVVTTVCITELGLKLFPVGTVATITEIKDGSFKLYKLEANNDFWYYKEDMFAKVKE